VWSIAACGMHAKEVGDRILAVWTRRCTSDDRVDGVVSRARVRNAVQNVYDRVEWENRHEV
jgi:hypothetical protein